MLGLLIVVHYPDHQAAFEGLVKREVGVVMGVKGKLDYLDQSDAIGGSLGSPVEVLAF